MPALTPHWAVRMALVLGLTAAASLVCAAPASAQSGSADASALAVRARIGTSASCGLELDHRYRAVRNPDGALVNPFSLAAFANLETRTGLEDPFASDLLLQSWGSTTRAGVISFDESVRQARLVSSRPALEDPFANDYSDLNGTLISAVLAQNQFGSGRDFFQDVSDQWLFPRSDAAPETCEAIDSLTSKLYLTEADQAELRALDASLALDSTLRLRNGDTRIPQVDGVFRLTEEGHPGPDGVYGTGDDGCLADGVNQNGECILLTAGSLGTVAGGVLDPRAFFPSGVRYPPPQPLAEPSNLTGIANWTVSSPLDAAHMSILSGGSNGRLVILGAEGIRTETDYSVQSDPGKFIDQTFGDLRTVRIPGGDLSALDDRRSALLGCSESFSDCGDEGASVEDPLDLAPASGSGFDFLNADAGVLTQEFAILKVNSPFALVGARNGRFETGITRPRVYDDSGAFVRSFTVDDAILLINGLDPNDGSGDAAPHVRASDRIRSADGRFEISDDPAQGDLDVVTGTPLQIDLTEFDRLDLDPLRGRNTVPTDFLIEPTLWPLATPESVQADFESGRMDERELERQLRGLADGVILFQDVRLDPTRDASSADNLDLTRVNPLGENCSTLFGGPDPGCTDLEIISQNLERFLIANEIVGGDDVFDPPETFQELMFMLELDPGTDLDPLLRRNLGDPISGPDGIVFNDFDIDGTGTGDRRRVTVQGTGLGANLLDPGQGYYDCTQRADPLTFCYETFGEDASGNLLASAMPIGLPAERINATGDFEPFLVKATDLDPLEFQRLMSGETVLIHEAVQNIDLLGANGTPGADGEPDDLNGDGVIGFVQVRIGESQRTFFERTSFGAGDLNDDQQPDLDEDRDGIFDQLDDGTRGPISDDNVLCGSGIPGDPLMEAIQTEYVSSADLTGENEILRGSLLPRSPTFCRSLFGEYDPNQDADGDLRYDVVDNCPRVPNFDQVDRGGPSRRGLWSARDGIGDACQCGDLDGDGRVRPYDGMLLLSRMRVAGGPVHGRWCKVAGQAGEPCGVDDVKALLRTARRHPRIAQVCEAAR